MGTVIGVLALQGAFREHAEALDALGADVALVKRPEHLAAVDAIVLPGGESTTIDKLLDSSGLRDAVARRGCATACPRSATCAGLIVLAPRGRRRAPRPAAARRDRRDRAPQRLRPPARVVRSRPRRARPRRGSVPGRVHPGARWSSARVPASRCSPSTKACPCSGARAASGSLRSIPSSRATCALHELFIREVALMSGHSKWHSIKHKKGAADAEARQALRGAHPPDRGRGALGRR